MHLIGRRTTLASNGGGTALIAKPSARRRWRRSVTIATDGASGTPGRSASCSSSMLTYNAQRCAVEIRGSGDTVACSLISSEMSLEIVRVGKSLGGDALVSTDPDGNGTLLYDRISEDNIPLRKYLRWAENLHGGAVGRDGVEHVERLEDRIGSEKVVHISFSGSCGSMAALEMTFGRARRTSDIWRRYIWPRFHSARYIAAGRVQGHGVATLARSSLSGRKRYGRR